ncbi:hypothetical protein [Paractinoplanes ferrugineus]|nr:hypothetical protein [Actinoplanes ferrugineus]
MTPEQLRFHAANLDGIRSMLGEVRSACHRIGRDRPAFGPTCGWILIGLGDRQKKHEELLAYVEETLLLMSQGIHRVADGTEELKTLIRRDDDDLLTTDGVPIIEDPPHSLHGLMESAIDRVRDREWVEPELASAAPVAEFAAPVDDRYAVLRAGGLACAMRCVEPLRRMLDDLAGTPEVVATHAAVWLGNGSDLLALSALLDECLEADLPDRDRQETRSYRSLMAHNVQALIGLAEISTAMGFITKAAGDLILLARDIIRGLIGDLFARVTTWIVDTPAGAPRPAMAARLAVVVLTAWRIHAYLTALGDSISSLSRTVEG